MGIDNENANNNWNIYWDQLSMFPQSYLRVFPTSSFQT